DSVAAQFEVLPAGAVTQGGVGEVEDRVGLVVGQVDLEDVQAAVQAFNEAEAACQGVEDANTAGSKGPRAVTDFKADSAGGKHRLVAARQGGFVEAAVGPALAALALAVYLGFHRKTLGVAVNEESVNASNTAETPRVFSFFQDSFPQKPGDFAC